MMCGMTTCNVDGVFTGGPGATNSMVPLTKFHDSPDLPPRKDLYMTPRSPLAPTNAYEYSTDAYISMNPARPAVFVPEVPPPQYEACSSFKKDEKLYAQIPGEYLPIIKGEDSAECEQVQYGNIPPSSEFKLQLQEPENFEKP